MFLFLTVVIVTVHVGVVVTL